MPNKLPRKNFQKKVGTFFCGKILFQKYIFLRCQVSCQNGSFAGNFFGKFSSETIFFSRWQVFIISLKVKSFGVFGKVFFKLEICGWIRTYSSTNLKFKKNCQKWNCQKSNKLKKLPTKKLQKNPKINGIVFAKNENVW